MATLEDAPTHMYNTLFDYLNTSRDAFGELYNFAPILFEIAGILLLVFILCKLSLTLPDKLYKLIERWGLAISKAHKTNIKINTENNIKSDASIIDSDVKGSSVSSTESNIVGGNVQEGKKDKIIPTSETRSRWRVIWRFLIVDSVALPLRFLLILLIVTYTVDLFVFKVDFNFYKILIYMRQIGVIAISGWIVLRFISRIELYLTRRVERDDPRFRRLNRENVDTIIKLLYVTLILIVGFSTMSVVGISMNTILAATLGGLGVLAVSFSARDLISSFIAAFTIHFDKTFIKGDLIKMELTTGHIVTGIIEKINWRTTSILKPKDEKVYIIPNSFILTSFIDNLTKAKYRCCNLLLKLSYKEDEELKQFCSNLSSKLSARLTNIMYEICFHDFYTTIKDESEESITGKVTIDFNSISNDFAEIEILVTFLNNALNEEQISAMKREMILTISKIVEERGFPFVVQFAASESTLL